MIIILYYDGILNNAPVSGHLSIRLLALRVVCYLDAVTLFSYFLLELSLARIRQA